MPNTTVMTRDRDLATIKVPRDDFEAHNSRRKEMDLTWAEYLDGEAPEYVEESDVLREIVREETRAVLEEVARA